MRQRTRRGRQLNAFFQRRFEWRRYEAHRAITNMQLAALSERELAPVDKLLHALAEAVDDQGFTWLSVRSIAERLCLSKAWTKILLARARAARLVSVIQRGGGRHHTSLIRLTVGVWRFDEREPNAQRNWAAECKAAVYRHMDWLDGLLRAHHEDGCSAQRAT